VARNWSDFTDAEKAAFTDVFARFLGNTYIDKIQGEYHNEQIVYTEQDFIRTPTPKLKPRSSGKRWNPG
jgi:ABC-type transporter MlaC component